MAKDEGHLHPDLQRIVRYARQQAERGEGISARGFSADDCERLVNEGFLERRGAGGLGRRYAIKE